jgi:uncharacterized SAM-binding protein YcdF (DUF218 family)
MSFPIYATSPLTWALLLLVLLASGWHVLPGAVRWVGVAVEALLIALMTPLGAAGLVHLTTARVPPVQSCPAPVPTTIVVLGGGFDYPPRTSDDYGSLSTPALQRVFAGVALWQNIPGARLVIAGGGGGRIREAVPMANLAMRMGVPETAVEIEDRSRNTWQNARNVAALSPPVSKRIWLVSSPMHLPRALEAFRAWGFKPCAWPSNAVKDSPDLWSAAWLPQGGSIRQTAIAFHELIGSLEYRFLAWRQARRAPDQTP